MRTAVDAPPAVEVSLVLAEVVLRLRRAGQGVAADRESMERAHAHAAGLLDALGVPADAGMLAEVDYLMLRCVAARVDYA
jgi:hypothetical protein